MNTIESGESMYQRAIKIAGEWVILLSSATRNNPGVIQFKNSSRKAANIWRDLNEPLPKSYQLNSSSGNTVWRARENNSK